tara:strand:- start:197 stop:991 length:795 start_codon:yes stop_codon:yes gene_type:complete
MNFIQPSIDPVILSISFLELRWYSLAYILGIIIGFFIIKRLNVIKGSLISVKQLDSFFVWAVLGIILGGRFGYVLFYQINVFYNNPIYLIEIWNGGMSFHGGLLGVIISTFIFCRNNNLKFYYVADFVALVAPIGLFFGRIANFINTELIGRPTNFFISVIYPEIDSIPRHPSQIYEALFEGLFLFIILIIIFFKNKNSKNFGLISGLFLIFYSISRFFIEFLREPDSHLGLFFNFITLGQILSIPFLLFGIFIIQSYASGRKD